jgi:hypothetical protein
VFVLSVVGDVPVDSEGIRSSDFTLPGVSLQSRISIVQSASNGEPSYTNLTAHAEKQDDRPTSAQHCAAQPFPSVVFLISDRAIGGLVGLCSSSPQRSGIQMLLPVAGHTNVGMDLGVLVRLPPSGSRGNPPLSDSDRRPAGHSTTNDVETWRVSFSCRPDA